MSEGSGEVVRRAITEFDEPQHLSERRAWVTSGVPSPMCPPHVYEFEGMVGYAKPRWRCARCGSTRMVDLMPYVRRGAGGDEVWRLGVEKLLEGEGASDEQKETLTGEAIEAARLRGSWARVRFPPGRETPRS